MQDREVREEKVTPVYEPGGKFYKWFDNFWYHNKWKVIIISFLVLTFTVCIAQLFGRESVDLYVLYAGPYKFGQTDTQSLESAFSYITDDRDNDGKTNVVLIDFYLMSDEQIQGAVSAAQSEGKGPVSVNYEMFASNRNAFDQQILAGDAVICLLDPWLYEDVKAAGGFLPLADALGYTPEGAVDEYSIRIGDTPLGSYFSVLRGLNDDTLLCVRRMSSFSFLKGQTRTEKYYNDCLDTFEKIFTFEAPSE